MDGVLGEEPPDSNGDVYLAVTDLSTGVHAVTLTVADSSGDTATASVEFTISYDSDNNEGAPTVTFEGPNSGDTFYINDVVTFVGTMTDGEQSSESLDASLKSSRDGIFWEGNPETDGTVSQTYAELSVGEHTITLTGEDEDGYVASDTRTIEILGDDPPAVSITAPVSGEMFSTEQTITFEGEVSDDVTEADELTVVWSSDVDGDFASGSPDSSGYALATGQLSEATHVIVLTATDALGEESSASVTIEVVDPLNYDDDGDGYSESEGDCDDLDADTYPGSVDEAEDGECMQDEDEDGFGDMDPPDGYDAGTDCDDGDADVYPGSVDEAEEGECMQDEDGDGFGDVSPPTGYDAGTDCDDDDVSVYPGSTDEAEAGECMEDADGDGFGDTEPPSGYDAGTDCDDSDATVFPGAEEVCDDVDNDCDDEVNEDSLDAYESNDGTSSAYDLGEVDSWLWDEETVELSGLNLHVDSDGDYFQFNVDDDYYDNVNVDVEVTTPSSTGDYTVALYMYDGGWQLQDSDSGVGTLNVDYDGSKWDEDEDDFIVAVYSSSWASDICEDDYEILIIAETYFPF